MKADFIQQDGKNYLVINKHNDIDKCKSLNFEIYILLMQLEYTYYL